MQKRCGVCRSRGPAGVATVYFRWPLLDNDWVGWRVYYCHDHYRSFFTAYQDYWDRQEDPEWAATCNSCGIKREDDDPVLTVYSYPPKAERLDLELFFCAACQDKVTQEIRRVGLKLEDRSQSAREAVDSAWKVFSVQNA